MKTLKYFAIGIVSLGVLTLAGCETGSTDTPQTPAVKFTWNCQQAHMRTTFTSNEAATKGKAESMAGDQAEASCKGKRTAGCDLILSRKAVCTKVK